MKFFDSLIDEVLSIVNFYKQSSFSYGNGSAWRDVGYNQVVLQRDTACELDGVGFNLVTSNSIEDEIVVAGNDLSKIKGKIPFARISLIQLADTDDEQKAYNLIRKVEYTKYHCFPDGYMIRTSSRSHKEVVRVSKEAVKNGIDFQKIGSLYISKYKENPAVKGVKIIFITDSDADFSQLEKLAQKNNGITETLNHIMNSVNFDCSTCSLKPVCDEVDGMKELHFKTSGNMSGGSR